MPQNPQLTQGNYDSFFSNKEISIVRHTVVLISSFKLIKTIQMYMEKEKKTLNIM